MAEAIGPARPQDESDIRLLLARSGLPESDVSSASLGSFQVLRHSERLVGVVGLEIGSGVALLRSLAVDPGHRQHGAGAMLTWAAERLARERGVHELFLLTTTAATFFAKRGYALADRADAPSFIRATTQFSGMCPSTATFMTTSL